MTRRYALGRFTKVDPGETIRKNGIVSSYGNNAPPGAHFDQLLFEAGGYEYILGSAAQVAADIAMITYDQVQQRFEDKTGAEVVLENWDRIAVIGMDTLTAVMTIDNVEHLQMFHIGNGFGQSGSDPKFKMGDAGGGVPYKIKLGPNTKNCRLNLLTDKPFHELPYEMSVLDKWYIANQGLENYISVNETVIYNPSESGQIIKLDTLPDNPYLIRMNGQTLAWASNPLVVNDAWFRDLNIKLGGLRYNGTSYIETQSRFTTSGIISVFPFLLQVNTAKRFMTDISALDTRVHQRTDSMGISFAKTANFVNGSNTVTFQSGIGDAKNGMRINGASAQGIPDASSGTPGTTILRNINTSTGTAKMYNALTGAAVNATATASGIAITLDNSGAAGGSHAEDYLQGHKIRTPSGSSVSGATNFNAEFGGATATQTSMGSHYTIQMLYPIYTGNFVTDGVNGTPRIHSQTQPQSAGIYYYYKA